MSILDEIHNLSATIIAKEAQAAATGRTHSYGRPRDANASVRSKDSSLRQVYGTEAQAINAEARRILRNVYRVRPNANVMPASKPHGITANKPQVRVNNTVF